MLEKERIIVTGDCFTCHHAVSTRDALKECIVWVCKSELDGVTPDHPIDCLDFRFDGYIKSCKHE